VADLMIGGATAICIKAEDVDRARSALALLGDIMTPACTLYSDRRKMEPK
jgi:hypothetical protein